MNDVILFTEHTKKNEITRLSTELKKALFYRFKKKYNIRAFILKNQAHFKYFCTSNKNSSLNKKSEIRYMQLADIFLLPVDNTIYDLVKNFINFNTQLVINYETNLRLTILNQKEIEKNYNEETNFFEKSSKKLGNNILYYFPFGFSSRYPELGPIDEFGFRNKTPISEIGDKPANEKRIIIFGGSGAWSTQVFFDYYFGNILEELLINFNKKNKIRVFNLAQPSATVLNDIHNFLIFGKDLKPDLVICHGGLNDLAFGSYSDKNLLKN